MWEIAQNGHSMRSFEICPGAGDTAVIGAEPTTSVSTSVQRKPTVWTGGGRLDPEAFGKRWKETEAFGLACVTSFHVS